MPFDLLKNVITYIKRTTPCPTCKAKFRDEDIFVMSTTAFPENDCCYGVFAVICNKCNAEGCLLVEANDNHPYETITATSTTAVGINEVLDMKNFLKKWKGDLSELFKE